MPDLMREKLGAYLDGELAACDRVELEAHVETCQACRVELEEMRHLSAILKDAIEPEFIPAADFKAQLMLQLPRSAAAPSDDSRWLPWIAPFIVLIVLIFFQVTFNLSSLIAWLNPIGLFNGMAALSNPAPREMLWFITAQATIGGFLDTSEMMGLQILNDLGLVTRNLFVALLWQIGAAFLYWGVFTAVWHSRIKSMWMASADH
ncbi:anti-sigma factor family protein [Leptolinea tardivitalis]|uniref:Putative zinc-finger domain-containing protein n=1 Tax=Leptolinea tardivitalis TaxID=229920 RepID=A0A0P6XF05_9CHLR|nr:zf-HC2 domain-containing protein [Leptolinea tardivitalis]KPL73390.1 hypothetical protein ADM99_04085 [Leptolinea tardivitalis]GAP21541.1 putative zinc-finger [Leptolinea tardivitalis]